MGRACLWVVYRVRDVTRSVLDPDTDESRRRLGGEQAQIIARLRAANEELALLESLRAGMAQMSRLSTVAMMSSALAHDVSQPLTAARNYLSALRRGRDLQRTRRAEELVTKLALRSIAPAKSSKACAPSWPRARRFTVWRMWPR